MKGKNKYIPKMVLVELNDIKVEEKLSSSADAFKLMAKYSQVGRELSRMTRLNFSHKPINYNSPLYNPKRGRKKRRNTMDSLGDVFGI